MTSIDDKVENSKREIWVNLAFGVAIIGCITGICLINNYEINQKIKQEYDICQSIDDKTMIRETSLGEYSCEEIEAKYNLYVK